MRNNSKKKAKIEDKKNCTKSRGQHFNLKKRQNVTRPQVSKKLEKNDH